jgi:acetyltransferase-like isoleucine patch superfamily enzyme
MLRIIRFALRIIRLLVRNKLFYFLYKIKLNYIDLELNYLKGKKDVDAIIYKGIDLRIHGNVKILNSQKLVVGDYVRIGEGCYFNCSGGLEIGDNVQLSRNILIYTNSHDIESSCIPYDDEYVQRPVKIGHSVWIGMNVTIAPGTEIGEGAVIGMGTVVSGIIPPNAIVVGQKHRIINYRDKSTFLQKKEHNLFFGKIYPNN